MDPKEEALDAVHDLASVIDRFTEKLEKAPYRLDRAADEDLYLITITGYQKARDEAVVALPAAKQLARTCGANDEEIDTAEDNGRRHWPRPRA